MVGFYIKPNMQQSFRRLRMKKALITGITGQDGSYLAELLLEKGYEVHGIVRRASVPTTERIDHILDDITIHEGDLSDSSSINRIVTQVRPDEIYNLAAQSHVQVSFDAAEYTGNVAALGVLRLLEAVRTAGLRHQHPNCSGKLKPPLKMKTHPFTLILHTRSQNSTVIG